MLGEDNWICRSASQPASGIAIYNWYGESVDEIVYPILYIVVRNTYSMCWPKWSRSTVDSAAVSVAQFFTLWAFVARGFCSAKRGLRPEICLEDIVLDGTCDNLRAWNSIRVSDSRLPESSFVRLVVFLVFCFHIRL